MNHKAIKTRCLSKHHHESRMEAEYCHWLLARQQAGEIKSFDYIYSIPLKIDGKSWKVWKADFRVIENDNTISVHECKGFNPSDDNFRLKLSVFFVNYPDLPVFVNKRRVYPTKTGRIVLRKRPARVWPKRNWRSR